MTKFERQLSALTPAAVDRDAMLFAAGRASAASPRWWKRACGLLVVTQVMMLTVLRGERPAPSDPGPVLPAPVVPESPPTPPPDPNSYLVLLRTWDDTRLPITDTDGIQPRRSPPLTAGSRDFH